MMFVVVYLKESIYVYINNGHIDVTFHLYKSFPVVYSDTEKLVATTLCWSWIGTNGMELATNIQVNNVSFIL